MIPFFIQQGCTFVFRHAVLGASLPAASARLEREVNARFIAFAGAKQLARSRGRVGGRAGGRAELSFFVFSCGSVGPRHYDGKHGD